MLPASRLALFDAMCALPHHIQYASTRHRSQQNKVLIRLRFRLYGYTPHRGISFYRPYLLLQYADYVLTSRKTQGKLAAPCFLPVCSTEHGLVRQHGQRSIPWPMWLYPMERWYGAVRQSCYRCAWSAIRLHQQMKELHL